MQKLSSAVVGEVLGTFLMVLFGTGSVACAVLTGALQGLWQVAVVWGFGVTIAIYCSAALSGAHLNPAVSLAFALLRPGSFPRRRLLPYWLAQRGGARPDPGPVLRRVHGGGADQPVRSDHPGRLEPRPRLRPPTGGRPGRVREH